LKEAAAPVLEEGKTTCCCARSERSWTLDPQGVSWETFLTTAPRVEKLKPVACCRPGKPAS